MSQINKMSEEDKKKILEQHKAAMQKENDKKGELKKGLQKPEEKKKV